MQGWKVHWRSQSCSVRAGTPYTSPPVSWSEKSGLLCHSWGCPKKETLQPFLQSQIQMTSTLFFCLSNLPCSCGSNSLLSLVLIQCRSSSSLHLSTVVLQEITWLLLSVLKAEQPWREGLPAGRHRGPLCISMGLESGFLIPSKP